jgi:hypothetical protein
VFTARYALSPYIKQIRFVFKGLIAFKCYFPRKERRDTSFCYKCLLPITVCLQIPDTVFSCTLGRWQCYQQAAASAFPSQNSSRCQVLIFLNVCQNKQFSVHPCVPQAVSAVHALQANTCSLLEQRSLKGHGVNLSC